MHISLYIIWYFQFFVVSLHLNSVYVLLFHLMRFRDYVINSHTYIFVYELE
mgnify:CR=1 FL=1